MLTKPTKITHELDRSCETVESDLSGRKYACTNLHTSEVKTCKFLINCFVKLRHWHIDKKYKNHRKDYNVSSNKKQQLILNENIVIENHESWDWVERVTAGDQVGDDTAVTAHRTHRWPHYTASQRHSTPQVISISSSLVVILVTSCISA